MSDEGLILHWDMFAIENGKLEDASGKDNDGLIQGSPQLVPDDIFGGCLSFNEFGGTGDRVTAADISLAGKNPAHTIEAWIYIGSVPGTQSRSGLLVLGPYDSGAHRWSLTSKGVELGDWDKPQFIATIPSQAWTHIAMVYDGKLLSCYINGVALEKPKPATFGFAKGELTVAQGAKGDLDFSGKIASIRVYDRALKAEEIVLDMQDDQTAMASFRQANPLDFHLDDDDDQQVLYITDDPAGRNLKVEITNASRQAIEFVKQSSDVAAADNCHLELRFRPGTLSEASLNQISVAESDWRLAKSQANGAGVSLYLLNAKGAIVKPTEKINLTLQRVAADGGGGARGTRVELKYRQLKYPNDAALIEGSRIQHLSVVNQRGRKNIPLHAGFVGSNVVLNDGASSSTLKLRITNALREDSIPLAPAGPNASRLIVSFDSELATSDHVDAIQVECEGWTPLKIEQGVSAEWILTNGNKTKLGPGESILLTLNNVKSSLPAGQANVYVRYENIPGYWDGQFVCVVEKAPLLYSQNLVGIGVSNPQAKLHIVHQNQDAQGNALILGPTNQSNLRLGYHQNYSWIQSHGSKPLAINPVGNNVGVGTIRPPAEVKLAVSASANHLQLRREATEKNGGKVLFLELFQDDRSPAATPEVYPSIRFHHHNRFWHRIEGRSDGIHFKEGDTNRDSYINVFAGGVNLGPPAAGHYIKQGINFSINSTTFKTFSNGTFSWKRASQNAIKILGAEGGALATKNQEVLEWHDGAVIINGSLWAKEKYFIIDHPTKLGRRLAHSCLEGPEIGVYYRGEAKLSDGEATIRLPEYFEALTRKEGRTVQLTAKGSEPFRLSYDEVKDGQFKVYGAKSNGEFSWEVKAVRADVSELQVEVEK